jgi:hypothetical protein
MKKFFAIVAIFVVAASFGCQRCKTCRSTTTAPGLPSNVSTFEACGSDLREVDGKTITSSMGGYTATTKTVCD